MNLIPKSELPQITVAVERAAHTLGHPDNWSCHLPRYGQRGTLVELGVTEETAAKIDALITSEGLPDDLAPAIAKVLRLIADYAE